MRTETWLVLMLAINIPLLKAFSFGQEGHQAIAALALQKTPDDDPQQIQAAMAVWADWIRLKELRCLDQG